MQAHDVKKIIRNPYNCRLNCFKLYVEAEATKFSNVSSDICMKICSSKMFISNGS